MHKREQRSGDGQRERRRRPIRKRILQQTAIVDFFENRREQGGAEELQREAARFGQMGAQALMKRRFRRMLEAGEQPDDKVQREGAAQRRRHRSRPSAVAAAPQRPGAPIGAAQLRNEQEAAAAEHQAVQRAIEERRPERYAPVQRVAGQPAGRLRVDGL